jgi:hypothetical protein
MADIVIAKGLCIFQSCHPLPAIEEKYWIVELLIAATVIDTLANASTV